MARPRWVLERGRLRDARRAVVPVLSPGVRFGEGLFETIGADAGRPLLLEAHLSRMAASAAALGWSLPALPSLADLVRLLARERLAGTAAIRLLGLRTARGARLVGWASAYRVPRRARRDGVRLHALVLPAGPLTAHKLSSYAASRWAREQARGAGAAAALLLDGDGRPREADAANLFVAHGERVSTPPAPARCLPGVLRGWCLEALAALGVSAEARDLDMDELWAASEVWLSSSLAGLVPVRALDDRPLPGRGPILARLESLGVPAPGGRPAG